MFRRCSVFSTYNLEMSQVFVFAVNMFGRGGVVVCFSLSHVGISTVFWERSTLVQVFAWKVRKKWCLSYNLKMYKAYNGEMLWEGEDMESAYMVISHIISRKC